ncbi:hypothetical protein [Streptomyces sp. NBC_01217]|uniref:hypothetical protein n=1 Tax=Streptomyces sp. NBC_01217 TaxID=2903779 RepID=UPI002E15EFC9|nr:hypothetical protein OG507_16935 [Streptomyces sp. NBC_01217]
MTRAAVVRADSPLLAGTPAARKRGLVSPLGVPTLVDGNSFAYRTVRCTDMPDRFDLGAIGHGPTAGTPDTQLPVGRTSTGRTHGP